MSTSTRSQAIDAVLANAVTAIVTEPLGMTRTGFALDERARAELVPVHLRAAGGGWAASDIDLPSQPEYVSGSRGLYSTPRDYLTFQRMLLGDGTAPDGTTVLGPATALPFLIPEAMRLAEDVETALYALR